MQHKCKVTVIDKKLFPDLQSEYLADPKSGVCPFYEIGDEFIFTRYGKQDDFWTQQNGKHCSEAWDCISRYIYTALQGGSIMRNWTNDERMMIACCNDGTRPVIFKIERIDIPEIPLEALREIIVNSFAHANYIGTSKNEIDIHPGRIAIYNPGSFPDGLIPEDFINKDISSKVRNEIICDVLYKCKAIESWATGFKKVYRLCEKNHIKVSYEKEYDGFWFFFFRNSNVTINDSINVTINGLTELEQIILKEISNNSKITRDALSSKTGRSSRHIQRALDTLKGKGYIKRIGSNKTGSWEVLK